MSSLERRTPTLKSSARFDELSLAIDQSMSELEQLAKIKLHSEERHQKYTNLRDYIQKNIDVMEEINSELDSVHSQVPGYIINRNIEIIQSYKSMYRKLDDEISEKLQRDMLFHVPGGVSTSRSTETGTNYALEEFESARRATALVDRQIEIVMDARNNLHDQQSLLGSSQWKLLDTNTRYQGINNLVHRIALRKRRDQYIVGAVIVFGFIGLLMLAT